MELLRNQKFLNITYYISLKKDKSIRFYIDYKKPNIIIIENAYSLPVINDIINKIKGKKYYSLINLVSKY